MNIKRIWLLLPSVITPYVALFTLWFIFNGGGIFSAWLSDGDIQMAVFVLIAVSLLLMLITALFGAIACLLAFWKHWDAASLTKTVMILQFVRLPAVLILSCISVILFITIFTFAIAIVLLLFLATIMAMNALLLIAALVTANRQGNALYFTYWWVIFLQFLFGPDAVAAVILYKKLKKLPVVDA